MNGVLALDPLFDTGMSWSVFAVVVIKVLVAFAILLVAVMLYIWAMRKVIADMQNRIGPNRAGPYGVLQTLADGIKLFFKEQSIPESADRPVFRLAPYLSIMPAFLLFCVVPVGGTVSILGHVTYLQVVDMPMGALFILAMSGLGVYGIMLAGWSSGSKYPLLGSVRASAQLLSYEAAFGLAILAVLVMANTLSTHDIAALQYSTAWHGIFTHGYWLRNTVFGLIPFVIFLIAATAEVNHPPFDLVEAEQELVGGFNTEYTGIRFAIFFLAEFMNVITMSAIATTLFLGGPSGPLLGFLSADNVINTWFMPVFWFTVKVLALLFATVWVRASLPRMRYDRLMALGWKYLIEIGVLWVLVVAAFMVGKDEDWRWAAPLALVLGLCAYGVLYLAMPKPGERVEEIR